MLRALWQGFVALMRELGDENAYARHLLARGKSLPGDDPQVGAICAKYLAHLKSQAGEIGRDGMPLVSATVPLASGSV